MVAQAATSSPTSLHYFVFYFSGKLVVAGGTGCDFFAYEPVLLTTFCSLFFRSRVSVQKAAGQASLPKLQVGSAAKRRAALREPARTSTKHASHVLCVSEWWQLFVARPPSRSSSSPSSTTSSSSQTASWWLRGGTGCDFFAYEPSLLRLLLQRQARGCWWHWLRLLRLRASPTDYVLQPLLPKPSFCAEGSWTSQLTEATSGQRSEKESCAEGAGTNQH